MELVYLKSPTGQQHDRALKVLSWLREQMPDLKYKEVDPRDEPDFAAKFHIKYAPGLIVNGRIEFVGIPRERMLLDRLRDLQAKRASGKKPDEKSEDKPDLKSEKKSEKKSEEVS